MVVFDLITESIESHFTFY